MKAGADGRRGAPEGRMRTGKGRVRPGDELPPLEIPITRTLIVAGAIASRDYQDVHHDAELAREKGSPDIFMNILTTNGLVGRYITDHFGPRAVLRKVAIRLGAPNYPGDTMVLTGTIEDVSEDAPETVDGETATVRVIGTNATGRHVTGTVTVTVPRGRPPGREEQGGVGNAGELEEARETEEPAGPARLSRPARSEGSARSEGPEGPEGPEAPEGPEGPEAPEGPEGSGRPEGPEELTQPEAVAERGAPG